jgi:hypothetical protein
MRKITKAKIADNMAQVLEHLPSRHEALSSNPHTTKERNSFLAYAVIFP